jgi:glycosyltransferase involved in cell wall biosynthesis
MNPDSERKRPRLLALATTLPARPGDGTPEFVLNLERSLADDYEITLLAPRVRASQQQEPGIRIERFPYFPRRWEGVADGAILPNIRKERWRAIEVPFLMAAFLFSALRIARRERPCVVHANWVIPGGLIALVLKKLLKIPYIVTVLGDDAYRLKSWPLPWLKKLVIRNAVVVSPLSTEMGEVLGLSPQQRRDWVVPLGVDVDAISEAVGTREPEPGRLLFVGRLVEKKGVDVLIEAMSRLPEARLVVAGDGPDRAALEAQAQKLALSERVEFLGQQDVAGVREQFRRACAVVVPSRVGKAGDSDGTPLVMVEAMAAGVPVVASRLGGLEENIRSGETGLLVEPESVPSLVAGLTSALSDPTAAEGWAREARTQMIGRLDSATTARRYKEFLKLALEQAPARCRDQRP